jgi:anti-sigma-K factor RskA
MTSEKTKKTKKPKKPKNKAVPVKAEESENVVASLPKDNAGHQQQKKSKKRDKKPKVDHVHESKGQSKALKYLKLWSLNKKGKTEEPWKFEKCRQIWLLQNCYVSNKVPDKKFKTLLKYMATIQGRMRDVALGKVEQFLVSTRAVFEAKNAKNPAKNDVWHEKSKWPQGIPDFSPHLVKLGPKLT